MNCEFCQSPAHVWFQCPKKPEGWKPVRLAKEPNATPAGAVVANTSGVTDGRVPSRNSEVAVQARGGNSIAKGFESSPASVEGLASPACTPDVETANTKDAHNSGSEAQVDERGSPKPEDDGSRPSTSATAGSSNGRTAPFDGVNAGSTPAPASKFDKVAYMRFYMRRRRAKAKEALNASAIPNDCPDCLVAGSKMHLVVSKSGAECSECGRMWKKEEAVTV